ncbi:siderophore-interacting protein [Aeromicrobium sp. UC242_57]|uniref:siderophore-interacting protein n=1 Tax=Aeromicrobium sp. UC242_57 TaxID=3374624 RepID=UPI0037A107CF
MKAYAAQVLGRIKISAHLVRVTLQVDGHYASTRIPDEYIRVLIPPVGADLALPQIDDKWTITYPEGAVEPDFRVYTISDHRIVEGDTQIDLDIALHDEGVGSDWAKRCQPGDQVGLIEPHGLYAAPDDVAGGCWSPTSPVFPRWPASCASCRRDSVPWSTWC